MVVFKVFGVDRLKGLVFDRVPILGGAIRKIRGLMLLLIQLLKIKVQFLKIKILFFDEFFLNHEDTFQDHDLKLMATF